MLASTALIDATPLPALIISIPDEWESITKSELKLAGRLESSSLLRLIREDIQYARSEEQDTFYRQLLLRIIN